MPTGIVLIVVGGIVGLGVITVFSLLAWSGRWDSKPLRDIDIVFYLQRDAILSSDRAAERATAAKTHSDAKDPDAIRDAYRHVLLLERLGRAEALKRLRTQAFEQGKLRDFALLSQAIDCWALWEAEDNWKLGLGKRGSTIVTDPAIGGCN